MATDGKKTQKLHKSEFITGTWNVRTLNAPGKLEELRREMKKYRWNVLGIAEMRWKGFGENRTDDGHRIWHSGGHKHVHGVGFMVHKDTVRSVLECSPVSDRIISIRIKAKPVNVTIIQVYAPTTDHSDEENKNSTKN